VQPLRAVLPQRLTTCTSPRRANRSRPVTPARDARWKYTPANRRAMPSADASHWAKPDHVAETMVWLCSPSESVVSGNAIKVGV
jgi:hypothetical protein